MSEHACEWCGTATRGSVTCTSSHRSRRHRWLYDVKRKGGTDPEPPPWHKSPLWNRPQQPLTDTAIATPPPGPRSGANARSGIMLSFPKAVRAAVHSVALSGHPELAETVERALTDALAPTQRRKLEARDAG